jgi:hypothetical protein
MKVNLLYKNKDFDPKQRFPKNMEDLSRDLRTEYALQVHGQWR